MCVCVCACVKQQLFRSLSGSLEVDRKRRAQSKSSTQGSGVPSVTTSGTTAMQRWCVDNWA